MKNFGGAVLDKKWDTAQYSEIIKYIKDKHHSYWKEELTQIEVLVYKILKVHYSDNGEELAEVHKLFGKLKNRLELILVIKQVSLYPSILEHQREHSAESFDIMNKNIINIEKEYKDIIETLNSLETVTNGYKMPEPGCQTFDKTYRKLKELNDDILENIMIEKDIMYKRLKDRS